MRQAIENSCNVALMEIGADLGVEEFTRYQEQFGFGKQTGIDLPGEQEGVLYTAENMDSASLATNAFGQNFDVTIDSDGGRVLLFDQRRRVLSAPCGQTDPR